MPIREQPVESRVPVQQAILLAAGDASRLEPLTANRPKGMLLVAGRPLLQHAVDALREAGIKSIVIVVGRAGERIQAFFQDGHDFGVRITYARQASPRGTADAVRCALPSIDAKADCLVVSGHLFYTAATLKPLVESDGDALLVDQAQTDHEQWVPTVRGERLSGMGKQRATIGSTRVIVGLQRTTPQFRAALGKDLATHLDLEAALAAHGSAHQVRCLAPGGPHELVVDAWDLLRLNERVLDTRLSQPNRPAGIQGTGPIHLGNKVTVAPTATLVGPLTIGEGCHIGDYTVVGPYASLRNNTVLGSHCEVRHSILNNNVSVGSHCVVRGSILDDGATFGPGVLCDVQSTPQGPRGAIVGADAQVGAGTILKAGAIVAPVP